MQQYLNQNEQSITQTLQIAINCLKVTFQSNASNKDRTEATALLNSLGYDLLKDFNVYLTILSNSEDIDESTKLSFIVHINSLFKKNLNSKSLTEINCIDILKILTEITLKGKFKGRCLNNLTALMESLFSYKIVFSNEKIVKDLISNIKLYLSDNISKEIYPSIASILQKIFSSKAIRKDNFYELTSISCEILKHMLDDLFGLYLSTGQIEYISNLDLLITSLYKIGLALKKHPIKNQNMLLKSLDKFISSFFDFFNSFLNHSFSANQFYIVWTDNESYNNTINFNKAKIFQVLNLILNNLPEEYLILDENQKIKDWFNLVLITSIKTINFSIETNYSFIIEPSENPSDYPQCKYKFLIYQLLMNISRCLDKPEISNSLEFEYERLLFQMIFPLLVEYDLEVKISKEEIEEDYVNDNNDLIEKQNSKTIRCVCAYILQEVCEKFKPALHFIIKSCIEIVNYSVNNMQIPNNNQFFFLNLSQVKIVETSIIAICILRNNIKDNEEESELIKNCLIENDLLDRLLKIDVPCVQVRIITLVKCFFFLFLKIEQACKSLLIYIYSHIANQNTVIAFLANDCLSEFYADKNILSLKTVQDITRANLNILICNISTIKSHMIYDTLYDITNNFLLDQDILRQLFENLCSTIKDTIIQVTRITYKKNSTSDSKQESKNSKLIKCFNILRSLCEKESYVLNNIDFFEEKLRPIVVEMKSGSKVEFDEDIILILTSLIKIMKRVPEICKLCFSNLPGYIKKINGFTSDLAELINNVIIYGNSLTHTNDFYEMIIKLVKKTLNSENEYCYSIFQCCLVIQSLLTTSSTVPEHFLTIIFKYILNYTEDFANENKSTKKSNTIAFSTDSELFSFVSLISTIYSGFIYYPKATFDSLVEKNLFQDFFKWTHNVLELKYLPSFEIKLIILGICSWIKQADLILLYNQSFELLTELCLIALKKQKKVEDDNLDMKLSYLSESHKESNVMKEENNFDESDIENESDSEESLGYLLPNNEVKQPKGYSASKILKIQEINEMIDRNLNLLKSIDEFEIFSQTFYYLLNTEMKESINIWISTLGENRQLLLKSLLTLKRIKIISDVCPCLVPRKVVKIKRRLIG